MENILLSDEELEAQMVEEFIAAWNRNYGGMGGKMSHERIEREEVRTKRLDAEARTEVLRASHQAVTGGSLTQRRWLELAMAAW